MRKMRKAVVFVLWLTVMCIIAFLMAYPFIFSVLAGIMDMDDFGQNLGMLMPEPTFPICWSNFKVFFRESGIAPLTNTAARTAWYTILVCMMAFFTGYVMNRYEFKGKKPLFIIIICSQVIPGVLTMIPSYVMMARFPLVGGNNIWGQGGSGFINKLAALYVPFGWGHLIWVFLMIQSMKGLPKDFEEAAEIDGCGFVRCLFTIVLPMQLPILAVIAVNVALGTWNDWMTPFLYIDEVKKSTLPAYIGQLTSTLQTWGQVDYPFVFAMATLATIPPFIIFLFLQKYIVQGIASAGVKG